MIGSTCASVTLATHTCNKYDQLSYRSLSVISIITTQISDYVIILYKPTHWTDRSVDCKTHATRTSHVPIIACTCPLPVTAMEDIPIGWIVREYACAHHTSSSTCIADTRIGTCASLGGLMFVCVFVWGVCREVYVCAWFDSSVPCDSLISMDV